MQDTPSVLLTLQEEWSSLEAQIRAGLDLDTLAFETKAFVRPRGVQCASDLLRLALVNGPGGLSRRETVAWACMMDIAHLTDPSLNDRLHNSCAFLAGIVEHQLACRAAGPCWPGRVLRVADGTRLSQPGSKGTDWRIHGVYDLGRNGFSHLTVTDDHGAEGVDRGDAVPGEIRIADRGFGQARKLRRFLRGCQAVPGVDVVVRLRWNALRLLDTKGQRLDLIGLLQGLPKEVDSADVEVWVEDGSGAAPFKMRVLITRKSPEATQAARKALRRNASRKQQKLDQRSLTAAEFMILVTSLAADLYPGAEVFALYRLRWQIELAFKRLKSLLKINQLKARTERGALSWIYAHLILALLVEDLSQELLDFAFDDLNDTGRSASLWRLQKMAIAAFVLVILGPFSPTHLRHASLQVHRLLADPPRTRKKQIDSIPKALS